jgi:predicted nucleotidyltransferase
MIQKNIKSQIKEYFLLNPTRKLRVRQIEKELSLSLPSVIRYTNELVKEKILKIIEIENIRFYQANRSSEIYILEKKLYNLKELHLSGVIDYFRKEYSNPTIILFGSYFSGEDIETSDVDIFIESKIKNIKIPLEYEKKLQRKIQLFVYQNFNNIENKDLKNNIINGTLLNGYLEVFR